MTVKQPDIMHVLRAEDGSPVVRWFRARTKAEERRWHHKYPGATISDIEEGRVPAPFSWSSPTRAHGPDIKEFVGELQAWFTEDEVEARSNTRPLSVRITLAEGLTPTALQRFPWARMLTIADAEARARRASTLEGAGTEFDAAMQKAWPRALGAPRNHPGRRGHADEFYEAVAETYMTLCRSGVTNPGVFIANELHYSPNTVRGWVRIARKKGYLRPARPGVAG